MDQNYDNYQILDKFNVPRETFSDFDEFKDLISEKNKEINLISEKTVKDLRKRHIIDCAQVIDLIDINSKTCTDIGSGAGLPGIVISIMLKAKKIDMKMNLYEKSYHKSSFLRSVSRKLKLNNEIFQEDIFESTKTGEAFKYFIAFTVATKVKSEHRTTSFSFTPIIFRAKWRAAVPDESAAAWLTPIYFATSLSKLSTCGPRGAIQLDSIASLM